MNIFPEPMVLNSNVFGPGKHYGALSICQFLGTYIVLPDHRHIRNTIKKIFIHLLSSRIDRRVDISSLILWDRAIDSTYRVDKNILD